jgi:Pentapeptide repeats (8 copies)
MTSAGAAGPVMAEHPPWYVLARLGWLQWAQPASAHLDNADLTGADLTSANLRGANLRGADLARADLTRTIWPGDIAIPEGWQLDPTAGDA